MGANPRSLLRSMVVTAFNEAPRMTRLGSFLLLFLLATPACIPPRTVAGVVRVRVACGGDTTKDSAATAVAGATVTAECPRPGSDMKDGSPQRTTLFTTKTNDAGELLLQPAPPVGLDCEIVVTAPNMRTRRFAVADYCTSDYPGPIWDSHEHACHNLWLDATLVAATAAASPEAAHAHD